MAHALQKPGDLAPEFPKWDAIRDMTDQIVDLMVNLRQSGHPGGSRSKVPMLVSLTLSGAMRYDFRNPLKRFGDRFILVGGHAVPAVYALLAVYNEALRTAWKKSGDRRYFVADAKRRMLLWEDLLGFRRNQGLSGHAEMGGKTLFLRFNTGPSGHGAPAALGEALALKRAGAGDVRVFAMDGEGGLTPGANWEVRNAAWGYGIDNLHYLVDWNDFGIDPHRVSDVVPGGPNNWFSSCGWRTFGCNDGEDWEQLTTAILEMRYSDNPQKVPSAVWAKTRKGRGYGKFDNESHGAPHAPMNSPEFWETKRMFMERYSVEFEGFGKPAPQGEAAQAEFTGVALQTVLSLLHNDEELCMGLADRLVQMGQSVPEATSDFLPGFSRGNPWQDPLFFDPSRYPDSMWAPPGAHKANRHGLERWGAWINATARHKYGRPMFLALSADLAHSTSIAGFAADYDENLRGFGTYCRTANPDGALLPAVITEFTNAGLCAGLAAVNLSDSPQLEWDGFCGASSTYGSFAYLKYGMARLFSQMVQDADVPMGKMLWVVGHSGPETADDSRTHFGIFSPGTTQLFPAGQVINCYPFEYNEVPVLLAAALRQKQPIVALHLTRPPVEIPDRVALGIPSHFESAKGAYVLRHFGPGRREGTVIVQGTTTTLNLLSLLSHLNEQGPNVKLVAASSPELFRSQPAKYQDQVLSEGEFLDSTFITNQARITMQDWCSSEIAAQYAMSADWDNRWRTGGTIAEVYDEAHLSARHLLAGIQRFASQRDQRLRRLAQPYLESN
jgi:transketolase